MLGRTGSKEEKIRTCLELEKTGRNWSEIGKDQSELVWNWKRPMGTGLKREKTSWNWSEIRKYRSGLV